MMWRLLPMILLASCVVRYGDLPEALPAEPLPPPVDFAEVEIRLATLLDGESDHDRVDRIRAAQDLARRMKTQDPRAQQVALAYLQRLVAVEERSVPVEAPAVYGDDAQPGFMPLGGVGLQEEDLGGTEVIAPPAGGAAAKPAPAPAGAVGEGSPAPKAHGEDVSELLGKAQWRMDEGDALGALTLLSVCMGAPCWDVAADPYAAAREAHVEAVREEAGARFLAARSEADPKKRRAELEAVRGMLADLADRFGDSPLADDVRRNLALVNKELEAMSGG